MFGYFIDYNCILLFFIVTYKKMSSSNTDPQKLEGRNEEDSKPREFFWDSVSLYVVGVIIALSAIDVITEFIRGSAVSCFFLSNETVTEAQASYINNFCSSSLPSTEYFPVFIVVHAILIAIPHYLWLNHYGGNFEFFFKQVKEMDRTKDEETGEYSEKNRIIIQQLTAAFTTYKQNWMFIFYVLKLIVQLCITLAGLLAAIVAFTDFKQTFLCPRDGNIGNPFWPLQSQAGCVFNSLRLFSAIHIADLVLLALLTLCFLWSLLWCISTHPTELSSSEAALFCFQSSMAPEHFVPKFPLKGCLYPVKKCMGNIFTSTSMIGRGPMIETNLDFLVLKLFRTDSGLGFVFREMQVLEKIRHFNDDDQRRTNLHKRQQQAKTFGDGDLIHPTDVKGVQQDLKWRFLKARGEVGMFDRDFTRLLPSETLVLPDSLRGCILGLSALAPKNDLAIFIDFGSTSLGIPCALSRVFNSVGVVNFNPSFKQPPSTEQPFDNKAYASDIVEVKYPENVLSSEIEKASDFPKGLDNIWGVTNDTADFIVIAPVDNKLHMSTISLFLDKIAKIKQPPRSRFSEGCILLTLHPIEVATKQTWDHFHDYVPPKRYFEPFSQKIHLDEATTDLEWPPQPPANEPNSSDALSKFDLRVLCGDSHSTFTFSLYRYPPAQQPSISTQAQGKGAYAAISFPGGKLNKTGPEDRTKVAYSEISLLSQSD